ncbi:MAG: dockerin type I repeat-containing protein, partial [Oscillospiraceae bacterium]|nr:dockerin type I repeat-containing protein [Oscillospiraceae bacterium]
MKKEISAILALVLATACFPLQAIAKACDIHTPDCFCDVDVNLDTWNENNEEEYHIEHVERPLPKMYTYAEYEELEAAGRVISDGLFVMGGTDWTNEIYSVDIINDEGMEESILVKSKWYIEDDEEVDIEEIANKSDKTEQDVVTGLFGVVDGVLNGEITEEEALQLANKILKGDATEDGEVDIVDVIFVNKSILGQTKLSSSAQKASDIDGDGIVSPSDSLAIMTYIVG